METSLPDRDVEQDAQDLSRQLLDEPDRRYPRDELRVAQLEIAFAERSVRRPRARDRPKPRGLWQAVRRRVLRRRAS